MSFELRDVILFRVNRVFGCYVKNSCEGSGRKLSLYRKL